METIRQIEAERARRSFPYFVQLFWPIVAATPYVPGWHIDELCDLLERVERGEVPRALINAPPRQAKSLITSVLFVAWVWTRSPQRRFICVSYNQPLANHHSRDCRTLIESPLYKELFPHVELARDQNQKHRFDTTAGGSRLATSVRGGVTGFGADIIIVDDPHDAEDASHPSRLEKTFRWFTQTLATRLNDPNSGVILVVAQRIHEDDLSGQLIRRGTYLHACFHALYEDDHPYPHPNDPRTTAGQALQPAHVDEARLAALVAEMNPDAVAAQLQQRPLPPGGGIFHRADVRYYDPETLDWNFDDVRQAWDTAFKSSATADYVCGVTVGLRGTNLYVLHAIHGHFDFPQTKDAICEMVAWAKEHLPARLCSYIIVEDAGNGRAAVDDLKNTIEGISTVSPQGGKDSRAAVLSGRVRANQVIFPGAANHDGASYDPTRTPRWVQEFISELERFPHPTTHDDRVDALSHAIISLVDPGPRARAL